MEISRKLKLNSLVVLALLALNITAAIFLFQRINSDIRKLSEVQRPLERAIHEMEINAGETASAVLDYLRDHEERDIDRIYDSDRDFEQFAQQFERLAEDEETREWGRKVTDVYRELKILGDEIVSLAKRHSAGLKLFSKYVEELDEITDEKLQSTIDRSSGSALKKLEAILDMEININEASAAIEGYMLEPNPEFKKRITDSKADFERYKAQLRGTHLSANEERWLNVLDENFAKTVTLGNDLIAVTDQMHEKLEMFEEHLADIDRILDDEIQGPIYEESVRAAKEVRHLGKAAYIFLFVFGLLAFLIVAGMNRFVSKRINDGVSRLIKGTEEYGRGNLDHRIDIRTKDELGALADAFNKMADMRKQTDELIEEERHRLFAVLNMIPGFVYLQGRDYSIPFANARFLEQFGDPNGRPCYEVMHDRSKPCELCPTFRVFETNTPEIWEWTSRDNRTFMIYDEPFPGIGGDEAMVLEMAIDITERKRTEEELSKYRQQLEKLVEERTGKLQDINKELESFAYSVSHDLRAPLRAIDGFTRILMEDYVANLDAEGKRLGGIIRQNTKEMGKLIDGLLNFSRLGRSAMHFSGIDMANMVNAIYHEVSTPQERKRVKLTIGDLPKTQGDPNMMRQVWMNLISNALKFTSYREQAVISVTCRTEENRFVFCIEDNGAGFDMKYKDKLFGVFQRLHSEQEFKGTGVGLALVQRIIHRHGGEIWAEGKVDAGATFYFSLPEEDK